MPVEEKLLGRPCPAGRMRRMTSGCEPLAAEVDEELSPA